MIRTLERVLDGDKAPRGGNGARFAGVFAGDPQMHHRSWRTCGVLAGPG
jgi:hypothetical protein